MDIQRNVKIKSETADTERIGFLHSLKAKILLLVAAAVVCLPWYLIYGRLYLNHHQTYQNLHQTIC